MISSKYHTRYGVANTLPEQARVEPEKYSAVTLNRTAEVASICLNCDAKHCYGNCDKLQKAMKELRAQEKRGKQFGRV